MFSRLLAATSPMATIETNLALAIRAYRHIKLEGEIPTRSFIHTHVVCIRRFMDKTIDADHLLYAKWKRYVGARKVWSLYQNLIGNEFVCPIDRWMLRYFGYSGDTRVSVELYDKLENKIKRQAKSLGITPAQRQVQIWCEQRGDPTSYGDLITKKEITRDNVLRRLT